MSHDPVMSPTLSYSRPLMSPRVHSGASSKHGSYHSADRGRLRRSTQVGHTPRGKTGFMIVLTGIGIVVALIAPIVATVLYARDINGYTASLGPCVGNRIPDWLQGKSTCWVTGAPVNTVITLFNISGHMLSIVAVLIGGLKAYSLGASWIRASRDFDKRDAPTGHQLGHMQRLLGNVTVASLQSLAYVFRAGKDNSRQTVRRPAALKSSFALVFFVVLLGQIAQAGSYLFGLVSASTTLDVVYPFPRPDLHYAGRIVNETHCLNQTNDEAVQSCGLDGTLGHYTLWGKSQAEGTRVFVNASSQHRVELADDQTAILVPAAMSKNLSALNLLNGVNTNFSWTATTTGIGSVCESVTDRCQPQVVSPLNDVHLECPPEAIFNATAMIHYGWSDDGQLNQLNFLDASGQFPQDSRPAAHVHNGFRLGLIASSRAYPGSDYVDHANGFYSGEDFAINAISCRTTVYDVIYKYNHRTRGYEIVRKTTDLLAQRIASLIGHSAIGEHVHATTEGAGVGDINDHSTTSHNLPFTNAFERALSSTLLAYSGSIFMPTGSVAGFNAQSIEGSTLFLPGLGLLVIPMLLLALVTIGLTIDALVAITREPMAILAQRRLVDPLATVCDAYGPADPERTWFKSSASRFDIEDEADRLYIGPAKASKSDSVRFEVFK